MEEYFKKFIDFIDSDPTIQDNDTISLNRDELKKFLSLIEHLSRLKTLELLEDKTKEELLNESLDFLSIQCEGLNEETKKDLMFGLIMF